MPKLGQTPLLPGGEAEKQDPVALVDAMASTFDAMGLRDYALRCRVLAVWRNAVGKEIASRTYPQSLYRGVLRVRASNAAWQNELTFLKPRLIEQLNQALGHPGIKDMQIISGVVRSPKPQPAHAHSTATPEDVEVASNVAAQIEDEEIRRSFVRLMAESRSRARRDAEAAEAQSKRQASRGKFSDGVKRGHSPKTPPHP